MRIEKIYFEATDGLQLFGLLHKAEAMDIHEEQKERYRGLAFGKQVVLSVHGMTSNGLKKREDIFANEFSKIGIDYFSFNNRGANIVEYFEKRKAGKFYSRIEAGSAYENFEECHFDIEGAIKVLLARGYETIYLQGHSFGSTKVVWTYHFWKERQNLEMLNPIKGVMLLSIVDICHMCKEMLGEAYRFVIQRVEQMVKEGKEKELICREYFLHPICAGNFLSLCKEGGKEDVVPFSDEKSTLPMLNEIDCKLFLLWGAEKDLIAQSPAELMEILTKKLKKEVQIEFIEGTGHNYHGREEVVAQKMISFLQKER